MDGIVAKDDLRRGDFTMAAKELKRKIKAGSG